MLTFRFSPHPDETLEKVTLAQFCARFAATKGDDSGALLEPHDLRTLLETRQIVVQHMWKSVSSAEAARLEGGGDGDGDGEDATPAAVSAPREEVWGTVSGVLERGDGATHQTSGERVVFCPDVIVYCRPEQRSALFSACAHDGCMAECTRKASIR